MQNYQQEKQEIEFLTLCGFDLTNGYWQEDIDYYRHNYPWLWCNLLKLRGEK